MGKRGREGEREREREREREGGGGGRRRRKRKEEEEGREEEGREEEGEVGEVGGGRGKAVMVSMIPGKPSVCLVPLTPIYKNLHVL